MRTRISNLVSLALGALIVAPLPAAAQSLRGSAASVDLMYDRAQQEDLSFYRTVSSLREAVDQGELVRLTPTEDLALGALRHPYVLPATRDWVMAFAERYHEGCGDRLVVTSGTRALSEQPRNGSPRSVHPTGMAVDLRKPRGRCLRWLRTALLAEERNGVVEATEERRPPHFHVAVLTEIVIQPFRVADATTEADGASAEGEDSTEDTRLALMTVAPVPVSQPRTIAYGRYRVRKGDTLWDIARRNDTTINRLRAINGLHSSRLLPGQLLLVPGA